MKDLGSQIFTGPTAASEAQASARALRDSGENIAYAVRLDDNLWLVPVYQRGSIKEDLVTTGRENLS